MSLSEFISMGGYGFYVWMSFGMTALLITAEVVYVKHQRKQILRRLQRMAQLNAEV
ncbi:MAG: heme exporter protein CcmD [Acidiferrobacterales bacterium]|jgi:heme exporter protein D|nr:heme exporter protein CcmD [Acidiferrobacterales bacterium]